MDNNKIIRLPINIENTTIKYNNIPYRIIYEKNYKEYRDKIAKRF